MPADPFDIPREMMPPGMQYQWCSDDDLNGFINSGWRPVPFARVRRCRQVASGIWGITKAGNVEYGGQQLMERAYEQSFQAQQKSNDKAIANTGSERVVTVTVQVQLDWGDMGSALANGYSANQWAKAILENMTTGGSGRVLIGENGLHHFAYVPTVHRPRWNNWLIRGLFSAISTSERWKP